MLLFSSYYIKYKLKLIKSYIINYINSWELFGPSGVSMNNKTTVILINTIYSTTLSSEIFFNCQVIDFSLYEEALENQILDLLMYHQEPGLAVGRDKMIVSYNETRILILIFLEEEIYKNMREMKDYILYIQDSEDKQEDGFLCLDEDVEKIKQLLELIDTKTKKIDTYSKNILRYNELREQYRECSKEAAAGISNINNLQKVLKFKI